MAVRPILIYGDPRLHEIADPVEKVDDEIRELVDDMFETKMANNGIGLAATQLGIKKAIIVIDLGEHDKEVPLLALINPQILDKRGISVFDEGCLSIPGVNGDVERAEEITIRYTNKDGDVVEAECSGLLARVIQHEYDHLQGILFTERMEAAERKKNMPQLRRLAKGVEA